MKLIKEICFDPGTECTSYKLRRAARAVLLNENGDIALMHVTKKNYFKLPGGGIEKGESIIQALLREVVEEAGVEAEVVDQLGMITEDRNNPNYTMHQISYCYVCKVICYGENSLDEGEARDGFVVEWHPLDKAIELLKNSNPSGSEYEDYIGKYMVTRDLAFLEEFAKRRFTARLAGGVILVRTKNGKQELLLQKRGQDVPGAGRWDATAGGHVDGDWESMRMAAKREAMEEVGVDVDINKTLFETVIHSTSMNVPKSETSYFGQYVSLYVFANKFTGTPTVCECGKCSELEWFPIDNLPDNLWPIATVAAIENFKNKIVYSEVGF